MVPRLVDEKFLRPLDLNVILSSEPVVPLRARPLGVPPRGLERSAVPLRATNLTGNSKWKYNTFFVIVLVGIGVLLWIRFDPRDEHSAYLPDSVKYNAYHKNIGTKINTPSGDRASRCTPYASNSESIKINYSSF